jgi:3-dehydroshikimate dehydratase
VVKPGLVSVTFRQLSAREIVELAAGCGLGAIEWGGDVHVPSVAVAFEVRRMAGDRGLIQAAFGSYWRASGEFGAVLEIALALGAPTVRVWAGEIGSADSADRVGVVSALRRACELAEEVGVTVSLEYHSGTLTGSLSSTLRLVGEIDHRSLRLYWQPGPGRTHSQRLEELRWCLPYLSNLHVFHWALGSSGEVARRPLAEGELEWREYLGVAAGDRYALLEFVPGDDPGVLRTEAATLAGLLT